MILPSIDAISAINAFVPSVSEVIPVVIESLASILTSVEQKGKNMTVMTSLRSLRLKSRRPRPRLRPRPHLRPLLLLPLLRHRHRHMYLHPNHSKRRFKELPLRQNLRGKRKPRTRS